MERPRGSNRCSRGRKNENDIYSNAAFQHARGNIPPEAVEILKTLGQMSGEGPTARQLAGRFNMTEQRIQYFLDLLGDRNLIHRALNMMAPSNYSLKTEGRKYLFDRG